MDIGREARAGRTSNIRLMLVTLDTSKLRRWLKPFAFCRVKRKLMGGDMRGESREGVHGAVAVQASCREDPTGHRGRGTREAHLKHGAHVRDAGCVEAQRLVEHIRALPSHKGGMGGEMRCEIREGVGRWWCKGASNVHDERRCTSRKAGGRLEGVVARGLAMCGRRKGAGRTQLKSGGERGQCTPQTWSSCL